MQSGSPLFYLLPLEQLLALQAIEKMSTPPSYDKLVAEVSKLMNEVCTLHNQV